MNISGYTQNLIDKIDHSMVKDHVVFYTSPFTKSIAYARVQKTDNFKEAFGKDAVLIPQEEVFPKNFTFNGNDILEDGCELEYSEYVDYMKDFAKTVQL